VTDNGPADVAGIKQGDIITKVDENVVLQTFVELIQNYDIGEEVVLEVLRNGEVMLITVVLGEAD